MLVGSIWPYNTALDLPHLLLRSVYGPDRPALPHVQVRREKLETYLSTIFNNVSKTLIEKSVAVLDHFSIVVANDALKEAHLAVKAEEAVRMQWPLLTTDRAHLEALTRQG